MSDRITLLPECEATPARPYAELLADCCDRFAQRLGQALLDAAAAMDGELQVRRQSTDALAESLALLEVQYQLRALARGLPESFQRSLSDSVRRRSEGSSAENAENAPDDNGEECLLPAFVLFPGARIEVEPAALQLAQTLQAAAGSAPGRLRPATAWLIGRDTVDEAADPLGPVALAEALLALCANLTGSADTRRMIQAQLSAALGPPLPALYEEAAALLAAHNIPPRARAEAGTDTPAAPPAVAAALPASAPPPAAPATAPRSAASTSGLAAALAALPVGAAVLDYRGRRYRLTAGSEALSNLARQLMADGLGEQLAGDERIILEVVGTLFDHLFASSSIPRPIKFLLARLQPAVLHVALTDAGFFASRQHPARRLLNLIALAGATWDGDPGPGSALHEQLGALVGRIETQASREPAAVFAACREALETWLVAQDRAAEARTATLTERLAERERLQLARRAAADAIASARKDGGLPESLERFLSDTWAAVMSHAWLQGGSQGADWRRVDAALQDLVWSVRPKHGPADRERLARMLKPLVGALRDSMTQAGVADATRDAFLSELTRLHAAAVRAGMSQAVAELPHSPGRQVAYRGDSAPEPEPGGELEVDMLERGDWVELREADGGLRRLRLSWVSPARTLYLFANRQGQRALALTREELVRRYTRGEASTAATDAFDRLVDAALDSHEKP